MWYVYKCIYFPWKACHPNGLEMGTGWGHDAACVCKCYVFCVVLCGQPWAFMHIYVLSECVHANLLGIHAQPHLQLVLGIWICSVGMLGMTSPDRWVLLCQTVSNLFPKQLRNAGTQEYEICFQDIRNYGLTVTGPLVSLPLKLALCIPSCVV